MGLTRSHNTFVAHTLKHPAWCHIKCAFHTEPTVLGEGAASFEMRTVNPRRKLVTTGPPQPHVEAVDSQTSKAFPSCLLQSYPSGSQDTGDSEHLQWELRSSFSGDSLEPFCLFSRNTSSQESTVKYPAVSWAVVKPLVVSMQSTMMGVFTPWVLTNTTNQRFLFLPFFFFLKGAQVIRVLNKLNSQLPCSTLHSEIHPYHRT